VLLQQALDLQEDVRISLADFFISTFLDIL
jgi:hypothetical protein